jgi:hypothetical protein
MEYSVAHHRWLRIVNGVAEVITKQVSGHHLDWLQTWMDMQPHCKKRPFIGQIIHHLHGKVEKQAASSKCGWNVDLTPNWTLELDFRA